MFVKSVCSSEMLRVLWRGIEHRGVE
jgi:hypothetical protein